MACIMLLAVLQRCLEFIGMLGSDVGRRKFDADVGQQSKWHCTFQV